MTVFGSHFSCHPQSMLNTRQVITGVVTTVIALTVWEFVKPKITGAISG